jgi:rhodanese-related sulfurtransferase
MIIYYNIMSIKSPQTLIAESLKTVKTISPEEALEMSNENKCNLIDIRDEPELEKQGRIEKAFHISRGLLEFSIHPDSPFVLNNKIDLDKELVLFCAAGGRSALAAKTLNEMGFKKVSHIDGGFSSMKKNGFKVKT